MKAGAGLSSSSKVRRGHVVDADGNGDVGTEEDELVNTGASSSSSPKVGRGMNQDQNNDEGEQERVTVEKKSSSSSRAKSTNGAGSSPKLTPEQRYPGGREPIRLSKTGGKKPMKRPRGRVGFSSPSIWHPSPEQQAALRAGKAAYVFF